MLDLFFRKYAWTANLALIFAAAWLSAKTVNTLVGAVIRPRPHVDLSALPTAPPRPQLAVPLDEARLYHLIGVEPPKPQEAAAVAAAPARPQNCQDTRAAPVRSDLRLQLIASVVAENPRSSLATIVDPTTRQTYVLGVGDQVQGAELLAVQRVRTAEDSARDVTGNGFRVVALLCNAGTKEYVELEGSGEVLASAGAPSLGVAGLPPPASGRPSTPPGGVLEGVRSVGPNRYEIDRAVIDSTLNNLAALSTQARIVPSIKEGKPNGFKLFSIQPGSLYASIGIESGDVIQRINGYEINSPEKALELYQKLRESGHVTIELERNQQVVRKEYTISGP